MDKIGVAKILLFISKLAHNAMADNCLQNYNINIPLWDELPEDNRFVVVNLTAYIYAHPDITDKELHDNWVKDRLNDGWRYGIKLDNDKKENPNIVEYENIPLHFRISSNIFRNVILSSSKLISFLDGEDVIS